jgi:hypothetical protein
MVRGDNCKGRGRGTPSPASLKERGRSRARAPRPRDVASVNGMANQQSPPRMYPLYVADGFAAIADIQYDWSTNTVPKFPTMLIMPKMNPDLDSMVKKDLP